jgi:hypothetical protein
VARLEQFCGVTGTATLTEMDFAASIHPAAIAQVG